jgi:hypothetical protein
MAFDTNEQGHGLTKEQLDFSGQDYCFTTSTLNDLPNIGVVASSL